ncbi:MAG: glycosyltransferase family 2 protein [Candidatus Latescibacteria bacterium]|nr:glycosyltransferase family 2 protein [Candidatus Latescibacterota bacterium]
MTDQLSPDVSIIIVSYNVSEELGRCLASLSALHETGTAEILVVENASTDGSGVRVRAECPWAAVIQNTQNVGFAAGVNQGLARARGRFILLLNPDAEVYPGTVERLVSFMQAHPECGIAGGQLLNPDGSRQESARPFPTPALLIAESLFLTRLSSSGRPITGPCAVDAVVGACLMARAEMVREVGPLDERFFLYSEETDWCRRARQGGWKVYVLPDAPVLHRLGRSTAGRPDEALVELYRSRTVYLRKYFGRVSRWATHGGMLIGVALRVVLWGLALLGQRLQRRSSSRAAQKFAQNAAVLQWYCAGCPNPRARLASPQPAVVAAIDPG